jgi:energy-coupling factor transport system permease protein
VNRRAVHPLAWWAWAIALGAAAFRTRNVLLLGLLIGVTWTVVAARRTNAPWARTFGMFLRLGLFVIVVRVAIEILFGQRLPGRVLFTTPQADLPSWAAGVTLGGEVSAEALMTAFADGLRAATLLICVGAANSLTSPYRTLRAMPALLYELGVVVTVGLAFAPQATMSAGRVRAARRLRGRTPRGIAAMRGMAVPVLEGALDNSLELAASMDSRGYGRQGALSTGRRRASHLATLAGAGLVTVGVYGVLDRGAPFVLGLPALVGGAALLLGSTAAARASAVRSRYRPDPWRTPEWWTVLSGACALGAFVMASHVGVDGLNPSYNPLTAPPLPFLPTAGTIVALLPAFVTPSVPEDES